MITKYFIPVFLFSLCACKTLHHGAKAQPALAGPAPMSCQVEGIILNESITPGSDTTSLCARYPCRATIRILKVSACGSSFSVDLSNSDTATVYFAFTLHSTAKIFPAMATQLPGLKTGDHFTATVFQHMQPGNESSLTVYDYKVVK